MHHEIRSIVSLFLNRQGARALIGKEAEDVVTVKAPGGNVDYEIISIKYI